MSPEKESTKAVEDALELLRREFPDASEDKIYDHFVVKAREDPLLQIGLLRNEKIAAKVIAATLRLARAKRR